MAMSRTFAHVPFHHAHRDYVAYYDRERLPQDPTERGLYYNAGPDFPRDGDLHWSRDERREWSARNSGRNFTRTMARQRVRAEIARQLADEQDDRDEILDYLRSFEDHADWDEPDFPDDAEDYEDRLPSDWADFLPEMVDEPDWGDCG